MAELDISYCADMLVHVQSIHKNISMKLSEIWENCKKVKPSLRIFMATFPVDLSTSQYFEAAVSTVHIVCAD